MFRAREVGTIRVCTQRTHFSGSGQYASWCTRSEYFGDDNNNDNDNDNKFINVSITSSSGESLQLTGDTFLKLSSFLCCTGVKSKSSVHDATLKTEVFMMHESNKLNFMQHVAGRNSGSATELFAKTGMAFELNSGLQHFPASCSLDMSHLAPPTSLPQNLARFLIESAVRQLTCRQRRH